MIEWLKDACFYQIYPQSFMDSNGDGIGDFNGIVSKLDYIKDIGFNAIWMNPCFDSPFMDAGYDIRNYTKTAVRYGSNEDLERLIKECHNRGIHILLDLVPGHTSEEHEWFRESKKPERNEYSRRYIWTDSWKKPPKGLNSIVGRTEKNGAYVVNFFSCEPALNYGFLRPTESWQNSYLDPVCRETLEEIMNVMRFWLDKGCDGFRVDMSYSLVKNDDENKTGTCAIWTKVRKMMNAEYPHAVILAEWDDPKISIPAGFHMDFMHHKEGNEVDTLFRDVASGAHLPLFKKNSKRTITGFLDDYLDKYNSIKDKGKYCFVSGNHDTKRLSRYLSIEEMKLAYAFIFTMPGAPFMYYGDEIGMRYLEKAPNKEGGYERCGSRTPMQWSHERNMGFSTTIATNLYLPLDSSEDAPTVEDNLANEDSLLNTVKKLLALRKRKEDLLDDTNLEFIYAWEDKRAFVYRRGSIVVFINPDKEIAKIPFADLVPQVDANAEAEKKKSHKSASKDKDKTKSKEVKTATKTKVVTNVQAPDEKRNETAKTQEDNAVQDKPKANFGGYKTAVIKSAAQKAAEDSNTESELTENKAAEDKAVNNKAVEEKVVEETAADNKALEEKAVEEKAAENNVAENKAAEEKAVEEAAAENKVAEEKTVEEKVAETVSDKAAADTEAENKDSKEVSKEVSKEAEEFAQINTSEETKAELLAVKQQIARRSMAYKTAVVKSAGSEKKSDSPDKSTVLKESIKPQMKEIVIKAVEDGQKAESTFEQNKNESEAAKEDRYGENASVKDSQYANPEDNPNVKVIVIKAGKEEDVFAKTDSKSSEDSSVKETKPEEAKTEEIKTEEVKAEEVKAEEVKVEEVKAEETKVEEAKAEEAKPEEVKAEEAKAEEVKVEEKKPEEAKAEEVKAEEVKTEEVKAEEKKAEEVKVEEKKAEEVKVEEKKAEEAKAEEKKAEEVMTEEKKSESADGASDRPEVRKSSFETKKKVISAAPIIPIEENKSENKDEKKNSQKDAKKKVSKKPERIPGINPKYRTDMKPLMIDIKSLWNAEQLFNINAMVIRNDIIEMDPQSVSIIDLSVKRDTRRTMEEEKKPGFVARFVGSVKRKEKKRAKTTE